MEQQDIDILSAGKKPDAIVLVNIEKAEITEGAVAGTYFLTVSGTKPWATMKVDFSPLIYVNHPDYWGIQVIGIQTGFGLPAVTPFVHTEEVTRFMGETGISVFGSNKIIEVEKQD